MSFFDHLVELRKRIISALAAVGIGMVIGLAVAKRMIIFIVQPMVTALRANHLDDKLYFTAETNKVIGRYDLAAQRILRETAEDLAFALSHVVHLFHPQIIVIGGGLAGVGEPLRAAVESALRPFLMEVFAPGPRIALAALGEDAVPVGALELARTHPI